MSKHIFVIWLLLLPSCWMASTPAVGMDGRSYVTGYFALDFDAARSVEVGIDDGSGFIVSTLTDDDADGVIALPTVPVGYRVAIGVPGSTAEPCLIYTTIGTEVQLGRTFNLPLFARVGGGPLGAELTELTEPSPPLHPHDTVSIADGVFPGWPAMRVVDESGVPDFPTFLQQAGTLPNYTGGIVITDSYLSLRLVPEPASALLMLLATAGWCFRRGRVA